MTTIIAIQQEDKVSFGADSQVTGGNGRISRHAQMVKITKRGEYIIAGSGECAPCDLAPSTQDKKDLYHFMIAKVVPSLKECFKDNGYKWDEPDEETKFAFLIAVGGEVFELADDMSICLDARGFYGVGSGSSYAIGALASGKTLKEALAIAADYDAYTSAPFIYYHQEKASKVKKAVK
jgi:ATP-dependent protease HslVU (ClpYQ) peptidase subunit